MTAVAPSPNRTRGQATPTGVPEPRERGAINTHGHNFLPASDEEAVMVPHRKYDPEPKSSDEYQAHTREVGDRLGYPMTRSVITTASVYGENNQPTLRALGKANKETEAMRGIVVVDPNNVTDAKLREWNDAGVRGVRVQDRFGGGVLLDKIPALLERFEKLGLDWHVEVWTDVMEEGPKGDANRAILLDAAAKGGKILIDHLGYTHAPEPGATDPAAGFLKKLMTVGGEKNQVYVALEGAYRMAPGLTDAQASLRLMERVRTVIQTDPTRAVWGSDWPYVAPPGPIPTVDDHVAVINNWLSEEMASSVGMSVEQLRDLVLVQNAERLYDFTSQA